MIPYTVRPLTPWIGPRTKRPRRAAFRSTWTSTHGLLSDEIHRLAGSMLVIQLDVDERWIRNDGMLYAKASPQSPAVKVSFRSRHGDLTYATDAYDDWQDNVRGIALSLTALRAVDRYGVSRSGEQYRGWTAIAARPAEMTREQAAEFLAQWADQKWTATEILGSRAKRQSAYLWAAKRAHPDLTGDDGDTMARLNLARDLLETGGQP